ncbi:MAG TPA: aminoacyl-tRNA hydrolase [Candidatus Dorea intestinavium]|nr:aminoacyl-tRNA hydrolase [Candidatus Dorea intestinavium]
MYLIVGLGNPGEKYEGTRHNVGFEAIDLLADKYNISLEQRKAKAFIGKGLINGTKVLLAKPQTFMNLSGESVRDLIDYFKVDPESELIVLSDDISLPPGYIRIRKKGSAGGHNGLKNIIANLGTQNFMRLKIGVGEKPKKYDLADYVLGHFSKNDKAEVYEAYQEAVEAIELILQDEADKAMNLYNKKVEVNKE